MNVKNIAAHSFNKGCQEYSIQPEIPRETLVIGQNQRKPVTVRKEHCVLAKLTNTNTNTITNTCRRTGIHQLWCCSSCGCCCWCISSLVDRGQYNSSCSAGWPSRSWSSGLDAVVRASCLFAEALNATWPFHWDHFTEFGGLRPVFLSFHSSFFILHAMVQRNIRIHEYSSRYRVCPPIMWSKRCSFLANNNNNVNDADDNNNGNESTIESTKSSLNCPSFVSFRFSCRYKRKYNQ